MPSASQQEERSGLVAPAKGKAEEERSGLVAPAKGKADEAAVDAQGASDVAASLRKLVVPIYLPACLATLAQTLVLPVLPLYMDNTLLASDATIGAVSSMQGLGAFLASGFSGVLISRIGERAGMMSGGMLRCVAYCVSFVATLGNDPAWSTAMLYAARFGTGVGMSCFQVARQSWMAMAVPSQHRGRANGLIGGCARVASTIGPALGGMLTNVFGVPFAFSTQLCLGCVAVAVITCAVPREQPVSGAAAEAVGAVKQNGESLSPVASNNADPTRPVQGANADTASSPSKSLPPPPTTTTYNGAGRESWLWRLLSVGSIGFSFSFVRAARQLLIPLKADALGLSEAAVGFTTAASFLADTLTFPAGGYLSDLHGRKAAGVPSLLLMGVGIALLASATEPVLLLVASLLTGVGNGLSSGLVMTIAQDVAPTKGRSRFIGMFKVVTDGGTFAGPMLVGLLSHSLTLDIAAYCVAALSMLGGIHYAAFGLRAHQLPALCCVGRTDCGMHRRRHTRLVEPVPSALQVLRAPSADSDRFPLDRESAITTVSAAV